MDQGHGIGIADDGAVEIGDRQGQPGALQQATQFAHIDHRRHAGRDAAGHRGFAGEPRLAKLGQRIAGEEAGHQ